MVAGWTFVGFDSTVASVLPEEGLSCANSGALSGAVGDCVSAECDIDTKSSAATKPRRVGCFADGLKTNSAIPIPQCVIHYSTGICLTRNLGNAANDFSSSFNLPLCVAVSIHRRSSA